MIILEQQILDYQSINLVVRHPNWVSTTVYNFNDIAFDGHYYFTSVIDNNVGNVPLDSDLVWLRTDISNRYAAIDLQAKTTTTCDVNTKDDNLDNIADGTPPYDLVMVIENNRYDAIAFGDIYGKTLTIEVFKGTDLGVAPIQVITEDIEAKRTCVTSWYNYYYCPLAIEIDTAVKGLFYRLQPVLGLIRVTISEGLQEKSSLSYMVAGRTQFIGKTLNNVNLGKIDYSTKNTDEFGITVVSKRPSRETQDVDVTMANTDVQRISTIISNYLGKIVLFINDEDEDSQFNNLLILGYIEDFNTIVTVNSTTTASFNLLEVI